MPAKRFCCHDVLDIIAINFMPATPSHFWMRKGTIPTMDWQGKKTLVTGATGFIGGVLAARLAELGACVTGAGRRLEGSDWLRDKGVTLAFADLRHPEEMRPLTADKDFIFHAAAWLSSRHGDENQAQQINVTATANLIRWAAEQASGKPPRFVHLSSIAVYGTPDQPAMEEDRPVDSYQRNLYGRTKADGEWAARQVADETGIELAIARPGMVYGPRSYAWTLRPLSLIQKRTPTIFGDGSGHAYPVFIDNLVDGLLKLACQPQAVGEAFNFVDAALSWRNFFGFYARMANRRLVKVPLWLTRAALNVTNRLRWNIGIDPELLAFYQSKSRYPIYKAQLLLDYQPRFDIDAGMAQTESWLRANGYLPARAG